MPPSPPLHVSHLVLPLLVILVILLRGESFERNTCKWSVGAGGRSETRGVEEEEDEEEVEGGGRGKTFELAHH